MKKALLIVAGVILAVLLVATLVSALALWAFLFVGVLS